MDMSITEMEYLEDIKCGRRTLDHVPEHFRTSAICLAAVKNDSRELEYVPAVSMTKEVCMTAVAKNGATLRFIPNHIQTEEICIAAVSENWEAFRDVDPDLETVAVVSAARLNCPTKDWIYLMDLVKDYDTRQLVFGPTPMKEAEYDEQEEDMVI